jgi:hypothetical protein
VNEEGELANEDRTDGAEQDQGNDPSRAEYWLLDLVDWLSR